MKQLNGLIYLLLIVAWSCTGYQKMLEGSKEKKAKPIAEGYAARNQAWLAQTAQKYIPPPPPVYLPGKDSIIYRDNTEAVEALLMPVIEYLQDSLNQLRPINLDSLRRALLTQVKPCTSYYRVDTLKFCEPWIIQGFEATVRQLRDSTTFYRMKFLIAESEKQKAISSLKRWVLYTVISGALLILMLIVYLYIKSKGRVL